MYLNLGSKCTSPSPFPPALRKYVRRRVCVAQLVNPEALGSVISPWGLARTGCSVHIPLKERVPTSHSCQRLLRESRCPPPFLSPFSLRHFGSKVSATKSRFVSLPCRPELNSSRVGSKQRGGRNCTLLKATKAKFQRVIYKPPSAIDTTAV